MLACSYRQRAADEFSGSVSAFRVLPRGSFTSKIGRHLQNLEADPLRIIVQAHRDDAQTVWRQNTAIQLVRPALLMTNAFMSDDATFESFLER